MLVRRSLAGSFCGTRETEEGKHLQCIYMKKTQIILSFGVVNLGVQINKDKISQPFFLYKYCILILEFSVSSFGDPAAKSEL